MMNMRREVPLPEENWTRDWEVVVPSLDGKKLYRYKYRLDPHGRITNDPPIISLYKELNAETVEEVR